MPEGAAPLPLLQTLLQTLAFERKTQRVPGARWLAGLAELVTVSSPRDPTYLSKWGGEQSRKTPDTKLWPHKAHTHASQTHTCPHTYIHAKLQQATPKTKVPISATHYSEFRKSHSKHERFCAYFLSSRPMDRQSTHIAHIAMEIT